jgi:hypothetical protein
MDKTSLKCQLRIKINKNEKRKTKGMNSDRDRKAGQRLKVKKTQEGDESREKSVTDHGIVPIKGERDLPVRPESSSFPSRLTRVSGDLKVEGHYPAVKAWMISVARLSLKGASQSGYCILNNQMKQEI